MNITVLNEKTKETVGVSLPSILLLGVCFSVLFYLFPYTMDDWSWGSDVGLERLLSGFANYNGRYFSNLLVLIMTRSVVLRCIISSLVLLGLLCLCAYLCDGMALAFWGCAALLLLTPEAVRAQAIVWTSGFVNYALSPFMILACLATMKRAYRQRENGVHRNDLVFLGCLSFLTSLIIENATVCNVILAAASLFLSMLRKNKLESFSIVYLLGALFGAALMFSNGAYRTIVSGSDYYRSVGEGGLLHTAITNYTQVIAVYLFNDSLVLVGLVLCGVLLSRIWICRKTGAAFLSAPVVGVVLSASLWCSVLLFDLGARSGAMSLAGAVLCSVFYFCVLVHTITLVKLGASIPFELSLIAVFLTGPLLFVNPVTPRVVFPSYVLVVVLALSEISVFLSRSTDTMVGRVTMLLVAALLVVWVFVYTIVFIGDCKRVESAFNQAENGSVKVHIDALPYKDATHQYIVNDEEWGVEYKNFYGLPDDISVVFD